MFFTLIMYVLQAFCHDAHRLVAVHGREVHPAVALRWGHVQREAGLVAKPEEDFAREHVGDGREGELAAQGFATLHGDLSRETSTLGLGFNGNLVLWALNIRQGQFCVLLHWLKSATYVWICSFDTTPRYYLHACKTDAIHTCIHEQTFTWTLR